MQNKDSKTGVRVLEEELKKAEQGNADAQFNIALRYEKGCGFEQNTNEAVKWYKLSAENGCAKAQNNLGTMYFNGEGIKQDYSEAVKWYKLAAEHGNSDAIKK